MDIILQGIAQAFKLLIHGDPEVFRIALLSLGVSFSATAFSLVVGVALGTTIGLTRFWAGVSLSASLIRAWVPRPP